MLFEETRNEVAVGTRVLVDFGLANGVRASLGHLSMRVPEDPEKFVIKGRGYKLDTLERMRPEDLVVCDMDASVVDSNANIVPVNEVKIHSCIYKARPDVQAVVHVHPKFTVVMSVLGGQIRSMCNEGNRLVMDPLPMYMHQKTIVTDDEGTEVAKILGANQAMLLFGHGANTVGRTVEEAVTNMIHLEHQAEMNFYAYNLAGPDHPYVSRELVIEFGSGAPRSEIPHFAQAMAKAGVPKYNGVWQSWYEDAKAKLFA